MAGDVRSNARDPLAGRIPIIVITGFLGSGKTTLLRHLLRHPGMDRAAVIINELGDVAIDHQLLAASSEQMTLLGNGCLCCTVRTDLQETLREMFIRRRAGEVIDYDRVFVETTGLADPVPVLHSFQSDGLLGARVRLDGVVTVVDAVNGMGQLDTMPEAVKQAAVADRIVLSKTDLASEVVGCIPFKDTKSASHMQFKAKSIRRRWSISGRQARRPCPRNSVAGSVTEIPILEKNLKEITTQRSAPSACASSSRLPGTA
jgi:Ni2+-binding GTPase involved in maturation of urease and hydrogenase